MIMNRGKIDITQRTDSSIAINITTVNNDVWVTRHEIADMFQIFVPAVTSNLRVIFKNEELYQEEVTKEVGSVTYYNLDMVIALAFRCKGPICRMFRQWLRDQAKQPLIKETITILHYFQPPSVALDCKDKHYQ